MVCYTAINKNLRERETQTRISGISLSCIKEKNPQQTYKCTETQNISERTPRKVLHGSLYRRGRGDMEIMKEDTYFSLCTLLYDLIFITMYNHHLDKTTNEFKRNEMAHVAACSEWSPTEGFTQPSPPAQNPVKRLSV